MFFSSGLLLPKVVEDRGMKRTDIGNLGSGIYFSDSLRSVPYLFNHIIYRVVIDKLVYLIIHNFHQSPFYKFRN